MIRDKVIRVYVMQCDKCDRIMDAIFTDEKDGELQALYRGWSRYGSSGIQWECPGCKSNAKVSLNAATKGEVQP